MLELNSFTFEWDFLSFKEKKENKQKSVVFCCGILFLLIFDPLKSSDTRKCLQCNYCLCSAPSCGAARDEKHTRGKRD